MSETFLQYHENDLDKVAQAYQLDPASVIDFASNVSPMGLSARVKEALVKHIGCIEKYPERDYTALRSVIGTYCGCSGSSVVVGSGSSDMISLAIKASGAGRAVIVGPCFSGYEKAVRNQGGTPEYFLLREEEGFRLNTELLGLRLTKDTDLLILCNPNNPVSSVIRPDEMTRILRTCQKNGIRVIVDETYVEFTEIPQQITAVRFADDYSCLTVVRGLSKFFSVPGLRLGYLISGDESYLDRVREIQEPWAVSSFAELAGRALLTDKKYISNAHFSMLVERDRVYKQLKSWKTVKVYPPEANYILIRLPEGGPSSGEVFRACLRKGMLIRDCAVFPALGERFIRFSILSPADNDRLLECLKEQLHETMPVLYARSTARGVG